MNSSGGLAAGGENDSNWSVTYARVGGNDYNTRSPYTGDSYVVSGSCIDAGLVQHTSSAQLIVPPGASTASSGGTTSAGSDYLPGNGTSGNNTASYFYRLAFTITGTGSGDVNNDV